MIIEEIRVSEVQCSIKNNTIAIREVNLGEVNVLSIHNTDSQYVTLWQDLMESEKFVSAFSIHRNKGSFELNKLN